MIEIKPKGGELKYVSEWGVLDALVKTNSRMFYFDEHTEEYREVPMVTRDIVRAIMESPSVTEYVFNEEGAKK